MGRKTKESTKVVKREGRGDAARSWELEMMSSQEQIDRITVLLSRGVLRLIKQDDPN